MDVNFGFPTKVVSYEKLDLSHMDKTFQQMTSKTRTQTSKLFFCLIIIEKHLKKEEK